MHIQRTVVMQKLFIIVIVPLVSLCAVFILLYIFVPRPAAPVAVDVPLPALSTAKKPLKASVPVRLTIESINVTADVTPTGLTSDGDMAIEENPEQVAWYKLGPKPGEEGSAVVAGHYGWKNGIASVFNDLNTLAKGDEISMTNEDGTTLTFVVTRTALYTPDQDATNVFRSDDGKAHLNLITCQGSWNNTASTYSERLVVFTDLAVR